MLKELVTVWSGTEPSGRRLYSWKVMVNLSMWLVEVRKKKILVA